MKRLDQLTFTRFIMVLLVLTFHGAGGIYAQTLDFFPFSALLYSAPSAVAYLYVLSGFVMALVYFRPDEKMDVIGYWRSRFVRIYPLYIISFALICYYYLDSLFQIKPQKIVANLFVVQAWIPAYSQSFNYSSWSMTVEFFFYAVFPFFVFWAARQSTRKLIWVSLGLWALTQAIHHPLWLDYFNSHWLILQFFPLFHLNSFILGVVGGIWYLREGRNLQVSPRVVLTVLIGSFLILAVYTVVSTNIYTVLPHRMQPMAGWLSPFMALFIVALAMDTSKISQIFNRPALVNLGEASYAIYILHVPVIWLVERILERNHLPEWILDVGILPGMILIGLLAHFYFDIPARKWLKTFLQNISARTFLLDLAILSFSAFFVIKYRFGDGREYQFIYREMERLIFWVAFFARPLMGVLLGAYSHKILSDPGYKWIQPVFIATSLSSLVIATSVYIGYATGWFENFPRSVFVMDWFIVLSLSLLGRWVFRMLRFFKPIPAPA